MEELQKKYDTLVRKYNALLAENEELQSILLQHGIAYSASEISDKEPIFSPVIFPSVNFTPDEKIALFYNPQNEMFRLLGTKRSFSQNETFFFSHPYPPTLPFST
ncbi:hypothetical protein [Phocaeicola vulgatus]|uniref:hypothetical protein n=1 Tax=Phocaeicola vulgatus TaxID=821 RepID=UPI0032191CA9